MTIEFTHQATGHGLDTWVGCTVLPPIGGHVTLHDGIKYQVADVHINAHSKDAAEVIVWARPVPTEATK